MKLTATTVIMLLFVSACTSQSELVQERIGPLPPPEEPAELVPVVAPTETPPDENAEVPTETDDNELEEIKQLLEDDLDEAISDLDALE